MTWTVRVREPADADFESAIGWYESEAPEQIPRLAAEYAAASTAR